jgi:hypothetical protein
VQPELDQKPFTFHDWDFHVADGLYANKGVKAVVFV